MSALLNVAGLTLRMILRQRAPLLMLLLLGLAGGALEAWLSFAVFRSDDTLLGKLGVLTTYHFFVTAGILMLLVLFVSTVVLAGEMHDKQFYILDSKPVSRLLVLLGKLLGLAVFTGALLLVTTLFFYGLVRARIAWGKEPSPQKVAVRDRFLVSRQSFTPYLPELDELVANYTRRLRDSGHLPAGNEQALTAFREYIEQTVARKAFSIPYGQTFFFEFRDLPQYDGAITVRYRLFGAREEGSAKKLYHVWYFHNLQEARRGRRLSESWAGKFNEFHGPGDIIGSDGILLVDIENRTGPANNTYPATLIVPLRQGLEILVPTGSFGANLARAYLMLYWRLLMLAAIGLATSTFARRSVAALVVSGFIIAGLLMTTSQPQFFKPPRPAPEASSALMALERGFHSLQWGFGHVLHLFPNFDDSDPTSDLLAGRAIPASRVFNRFLLDTVLRGGVFMGLGVFALYRREVGIPFV